MDLTIEYLSLGIYLLFLIGIGVVFARLNRNLSDYVRGGGKASWWLVGTSSLMASISAFTFTGNASAAYEAGPTLLIIYAANCGGFLLGYFFLAAWFRQTRAYTMADIIRWRFGVGAEQFNVLVSGVLFPLGASIQLWALGVFASSIFGFPLTTTIIVIGVVVLFYSTSGGRWAVMATDFVQSLILLPITIVMAWYALQHVGGVSGLLAKMSAPGIAEDFRWIKEAGQFMNDRYTLKWCVAVFIMQFANVISIAAAPRYLSVKDGAEGRKAALLSCVLMFFGALIWVLPPMVARLTLGEEVAATGLDNPAEASYAIAAIRLLPNGLLGIMIVAMFASTMSSMDTGLNTTTGNLVRNLWPALQRRFRWKELSAALEVRLCRRVTFALGIIVIGLSLLLSAQQSFQLFDAYFVVSTIIGLPIAVPLVVGLFIRKLPFISFFIIFGCSILPSLYSFAQKAWTGTAWTIQDRAIWIFVFGAVGVGVSLLLRRWEHSANRARINELFGRMHRPVTASEEEGVSMDTRQSRMMGNISLAAGVFLLCLGFFPNTPGDRIAVLFVPFSVLLVGLLLRRHGRGGQASPADTTSSTQ